MIKSVTLEVDGLTLAAIQNGLQLGILQLQTALAIVQSQTQAQIDADLAANTPSAEESDEKLP